MTDDELASAHSERALTEAVSVLSEHLLAKHGVAIELGEENGHAVLKLIGTERVAYSHHQPPDGRASRLKIFLP